MGLQRRLRETRWTPVTGRRRRRAAAAVAAVQTAVRRHQARVAMRRPWFSRAATAVCSRAEGPPRTSRPRSPPRSKWSYTHPFTPPNAVTSTGGDEIAAAPATANSDVGSRRSAAQGCGSQYLLSLRDRCTYRHLCGGWPAH